MPGLPPSGRKNRGKRVADKEEKLDLTIIMNLMVILIPALLSQQVTDYYRHDVEFPTQGGAAAPGSEEESEAPKEQLNLKLQLNPDQSVTLVNTRVVGADNQLTIPALRGVPDYRAVTTALAEEKDNRPPGNYADPDQITVVAPQGASYQDVISILDAIRLHPTKETDGVQDDLFPIISLSPGSIG